MRMEKLELLNKFVAPSWEIRFYITKPIRQGNHLYATNGHILVRVDDDPLIQDAFEAMKPAGDTKLSPPNCAKLLENFPTEWFEPLDISNLPAPAACKACDGSGKVYECDDCDGKGEFDHGDWTYDCKNCDGSGYVTGEHGVAATCTDCNGTGEDDHIVVPVRTAKFKLRYVKLLGSLPGIELSINPQNPDTTHYFRFNGGVGAVMPVRSR